MKNIELFQLIDRFCTHDDKLNTFSNTDLVYTILAHRYLYIRPGKNTEEFTSKVVKALKKGVNGGFNEYIKDDYYYLTIDEWTRISMAETTFEVVKASFDREFFEEQIALLDADEEFDETLLERYLSRMNMKQLHTFMGRLTYVRSRQNVFIDIKSNEPGTVLGRMHALCRKEDPTIPELLVDRLDYFEFVNNNPFYMFDCLGKEGVVRALKHEIVINKGLAGHIARSICCGNSMDSIDKYIELISTYERTFGRDIYNPDIFHESLSLNRKEVMNCENQT